MNKNTIRQAAELSGVSVASVSRALNGKPGISEKTRQRIIEICDQLGYRPSEAARRLKIGPNSHVGLCLGPSDQQHSHYVASLFEALNGHLLNDGMVLSIYPHDQVESLIKESGAAILIGISDADPRPLRLKEAGVPFVTIGKYPESFWVCPDDAQGGKLAAEHMLTLGCQQHLIIETRLEGKGTQARIHGYQDLLQQQGLLPSHLFVENLMSVELQTYRTLSKLLQKGNFQFDGIFCENDDIAYGALLACEDAGYKVPESIKIVGFDDFPNLFNELTTVKQDIAEIAKSTLALLYEAKKGLNPRSILIPVELVTRRSSCVS